MIECETCGTESADLVTVFYNVRGLGQDYSSPMNACANCIAEVREFRPHHTLKSMEWRLVPIN
jgi:hypothetical protein